MRKWLVSLTLCLVFMAPVLSAQSIGSLPFVESFVADTWFRWVSQGAVARHMVGANWDGGNAARFWLPTANQGYAGLGQFTFASGLRPTQINIRFVYQWGSTFFADDSGLGLKQIILNRSTGLDQDRVVVMQHSFLAAQYDLGVGNNIEPFYPSPRVWDYSAHTGNPVCFEFEMVVGGQFRVWVTKRSDASWNQRLLLSTSAYNSNGYWAYVNLIGAFGGPGRRGSADPNAWFQIGNLEIRDTYIGPPAGFLLAGGARPAAPTGVQIIR